MEGDAYLQYFAVNGCIFREIEQKLWTSPQKKQLGIDVVSVNWASVTQPKIL